MKKTISNGYLGSVYTDAKVSKVVIKGIEGKTVKTVNSFYIP